MVAGMNRYERFAAWQAAHALVLDVYRHSRAWPVDERYGLTSQARRAAFSVTANIVEGSARRGAKEFRHFLDIAFGSLAEVGYALRVARDLGFEPPAEAAAIEMNHVRTARALWSLMKSVSRSAGPR